MIPYFVRAQKKQSKPSRKGRFSAVWRIRSRFLSLTGVAACGKMKGVKRMSKNLKYAPRRKMNLDATSYGPLIKLVIALAVLAALVLVVVFVALPLINARVSSGQPLFGNSPAVEPAKQTPVQLPLPAS